MAGAILVIKNRQSKRRTSNNSERHRVSVTPGIWLGLDGLYYAGATGVIDGNKSESLANARIGLTVALPINRYNSVKLYGTTGLYTKPGTDFDQLGIAWQLRWGGGL